MSASEPAEWLRFATTDMAAARRLLTSEPLPAVAAYHAQQAAEKAMKAVLVARNARVPKIHDLLALARLLPDVGGLPPDAALDVLTYYAVDSRYPDDMPDVSEDEAREAVALAETVLAAVCAALGA